MSRGTLIILTAVAGLVLGFGYGKFVAPVEYVDTEPASLRVDYRSDYVLTLAERYAGDHDVELALRDLGALGTSSPDQLCAEAIQFAHSARYSDEDITTLQTLLRAIQGETLMNQAGTGAR